MYRFYIRFIIFCIFSLFIQSETKAESDTYSIQGFISGLPDGTKLYLLKRGGSDTVDLTKSHKGAFRFSGSLSVEGEIYFIKLDTSLLKFPKDRKPYVRLMLDNSTIVITAALSTWPKIIIKGSMATLELELMLKKASMLTNMANNSRSAMSDLEIKGRSERTRKALIELIRENNNSYAAPLVIINYFPQDLQSLIIAYSLLTDKAKNGYYGQKLKLQHIPAKEASGKIVQNELIPDFIVVDKSGERKSIRDIINHKKLTLIDVWASWCKPCRAAVPQLKKIYGEYADKGFNIIGVSQDNNENSWAKAIGEDDVPWTQYVDRDKMLNKLFLIGAIPAYILVDNTGKLIAFLGVADVPNFGPEIDVSSLPNTLKKLLK